jgi:hypothetical protein
MVGLITLMCGSACILLLGRSEWLWLFLSLLAFMGFPQTHFIVNNQTLIQTVVPDSISGRVSSVWHYERGLTPRGRHRLCPERSGGRIPVYGHLLPPTVQG